MEQEKKEKHFWNRGSIKILRSKIGFVLKFNFDILRIDQNFCQIFVLRIKIGIFNYLKLYLIF